MGNLVTSTITVNMEASLHQILREEYELPEITEPLEQAIRNDTRHLIGGRAAPVIKAQSQKLKRHYFKKWHLGLLTATVGFVYFRSTDFDTQSSTVKLYRKIPLRTLSRIWGQINQLDLPLWLRTPVFRLYIWVFGCNLKEAAEEDLKHYKNLGEFFRRQLKPNVRPIANFHTMTSPADGTILNFGRIENGVIEQVKGMTFSLQGFLGPENWTIPGHKPLRLGPDRELYHCVIYLSPGDYHRFHSPVNWTVYFRRHFPGELMSVSPAFARVVQGLFNLNERALYIGAWKYGFFSMTAVGATNVGSIKIYNDHDLQTNTAAHYPDGTHFDRYLSSTNACGININKGEMFGEFNLGSSIVLVFEAPKSFQFTLKKGQRIKFGEPMGTKQ